MKVRLRKDHKVTGQSSTFNMSAIDEVKVYFDIDDVDSCFVKEIDVFITKTSKWKSLYEAFKDHDVITDNYNSHFFEPKNEEDRKRGYSL
jgi:hypothetical protein